MPTKFRSFGFPENLSEVVIDLGSYQTRVMVATDSEPTIVPSCMVQTREDSKVISIGQDAKEIVGRSAIDLEVVSPIQEGNFTDYRLAKLFLRYCFAESIPSKAFFFVTPQMNEVQYRALLKITRDLGIHHTILLVRPLIAALAKQVVPTLHSASSLQLLIDCGYESTTFSILQFEKVFHFHRVWYGGKDLTQDIQHLLKIKFHLEIGSQSAERLKQECAHVLMDRKESFSGLLNPPEISKKDHFVVVRGRDVMSSLPKSMKLSAEEFRPMFEQYVESVIDQITILTEELGPELIEELINTGFLVFGGMAVVDMLSQRIEERYGTSVRRPPYPDLLYHQGFKEFLQLPNNQQKKCYFVPDWL